MSLLQFSVDLPVHVTANYVILTVSECCLVVIFACRCGVSVLLVDVQMSRLNCHSPVATALLSTGWCSVLLMVLLWPGGARQQSPIAQISCAQRHRLIGLKQRDRVVTVERVPGSRVTLTCHHCSESDRDRPRRWYRTPELWSVDQVGQLVDTTAEESRFAVSRDYSLTISDLDVNDTGLYYCYDVHHSDSQKKFVYAVDMLFPQAVEPVVGRNDSDLKRYIDEHVNKTMRQQLESHWRFKRLQLYLQWEPWSRCHACKDQPGEMWRLGQLRLRHYDFQHQRLNNTSGEHSLAYKVGLAARSMHVFLHEKQLSLCVRELPDYLQKSSCQSARACRRQKSHRNMRAEKSFLAKLGPGPRKRFHCSVYEHDPVILECPWPQEPGVLAKLKHIVAKSYVGKMMGFKSQRPKDRSVDWYYYATLLNTSSLFEQTAHRIRVSRDGRLMFGAVHKSDRGRYSCAEDGIDIAVIQLKIKPTFDLSQSRTAFRIIGSSMAFNALVFLFVMVVLFRQRRVQRLLAGARWRHELRDRRHEESDKRKRFLLRQKRQLAAMNVGKDDADKLLVIMEEAMVDDTEEEEQLEEDEMMEETDALIESIEGDEPDEYGSGIAFTDEQELYAASSLDDNREPDVVERNIDENSSENMTEHFDFDQTGK